MKRFAILIWIISITTLTEATIIISLGEMCSTAAALRTYGIREAAYPFDWTIVSLSSLCHVLEDNFQNYFEENSFQVRSDNKGIINRFGIEFLHDLPITDNDKLVIDWTSYVPEAVEKYERRINRFRNAVTGTQEVIFIRHYGITKDTALSLRNFLQYLYPTLNFTLVVVSPSPEFQDNWQLHRIKNFYLDDSQVWNDPAQWAQIFQSLGL